MLNPVRPGHEIIKKTQVCAGRMFGNFSKKQLKILVGIKQVGLGCFNEALESGTGFCTIIGFDQDEILPTYGEWTDSLLGILFLYMDNMPSVRFGYSASARRTGFLSIRKKVQGQVHGLTVSLKR